MSLQLTKQKRNDFKPRDDDLSFARVNTEPCIACSEALEKIRDAAQENLSGKNLEVFLTEIGVAFHRSGAHHNVSSLTNPTFSSLLLEHLKKFSVNPTGGLMLAKFVIQYLRLHYQFQPIMQGY